MLAFSSSANAGPRAAFEAEIFLPERLAKIIDNFDLTRVEKILTERLASEARNPPQQASESLRVALATAINKHAPNRQLAGQILRDFQATGMKNLSPEARSALVLAVLKLDYWAAKAVRERTGEIPTKSYERNHRATMALLKLKPGADPLFRDLNWCGDTGQLEFKSKKPLPLNRFKASLEKFAELLGIPFDQIAFSRDKGIEAVHFHMSNDPLEWMQHTARRYHVLVAMRLANRGRVSNHVFTQFTRDIKFRGMFSHRPWSYNTSDDSHVELRKHWAAPMEEIEDWFSIAKLRNDDAAKTIAQRIDSELAQLRERVESGEANLLALFAPKNFQPEKGFRESFILDAALLVGDYLPDSPHLAWLVAQEDFAKGIVRQVKNGEIQSVYDAPMSLQKLMRALGGTPAGNALFERVADALNVSNCRKRYAHLAPLFRPYQPTGPNLAALPHR